MTSVVDETDTGAVQVHVVAATPAANRLDVCVGEDGASGDSASSCSSARLKRMALRGAAAAAALITIAVIVAVQSVTDVNLIGVEQLVQTVKGEVQTLLHNTMRPTTL